jgi:hypothetical protein
MFTRFASALRSRAARSPASLARPAWSRQAPFFTQRTLQQGFRAAHPPPGPGFKTLHAGMLNFAVYMSIAILLTDPALQDDWRDRRNAGLEIVQSVTLEQDVHTRLKRFWELGPSLLSSYCRSPVTHHGALPLGPESDWRDEIETRLFSAPDPDDPEKNFVVCQVSFKDQTELDSYVAVYGNILTDVAEDILPTFEKTAKAHGMNRGAVLILQPSSDWKSIYFDGKRYISVVFLEWQTAESMGLA